MIKTFLELLRPKDIRSKKIRLGPFYDGGYVLPEIILENCTTLFTYGVGENYQFEEDFIRRYNKPVYMFDHTLGRENYVDNLLHYFNQGLGFEQNCDDAINHYTQFSIEGNVLLKIDIEGGEYDYFQKVNLEKLTSLVNGICLEVHSLDNKQKRDEFYDILLKLDKYFVLTHVHGNNNAGLFEYEEYQIPIVLEFTFVNRKLVNIEEEDNQTYPIEGLDASNHIHLTDYKLEFTKKRSVRAQKHYTPSDSKKANSDVVSAGTSDSNTKIIQLPRVYADPIFYPRKFKKWPDRFAVTLLEDNSILVERTDDRSGGWGDTLLIDVEFNTGEQKQNLKSQKIPRVIYQTFETLEVPDGMYKSIDSWKNSNIEYEHYFFTEEDRISFIEKYFDDVVLDTYLRIIPGAFKADLWRCCILYEKGGIYVDADMICLSSLESLIEESDEFLISRDDPMANRFLANGFIASIPKHPFLKKQIDNIVDNVQNLRERYYLDISGPALFGKSVNEVCGRGEYNDFELGVYSAGGYTFKILEHDWKNKTFKYDGKDILITEYPDKNSEMSELGNPSFYSLVQKKMIYQAIPRNIYTTSYDSLGLNVYMFNSFSQKNPRWTLKHFTDEKCIEFFEEHREDFKELLGIDVLEFYLTLENGGERSDFWRYCIIYLKGGVYTDADTYCNVELNEWVKHHDLILGIEGCETIEISSSFGMNNIGVQIGDKIISVCNWTFAAKSKHEFLKELILDIYHNPIKGNVLLHTGPGRLTKHVTNYFSDLEKIDTEDVEKNNSILYSINRFGSNQSHSNAYKNYANPLDVEIEGVYVVHLFEGSWRTSRNKPIEVFKSTLGVSHNITLRETEEGYLGVARLDKETSRTLFMKRVGDCRSIVESTFDKEFNLLTEEEKPITGYSQLAKFEDYRHFTYKGENYFATSYVDEDFNTKVALLDSNYNFLGDVNIESYNVVSWIGVERIWEKNWLFFEKDNTLYFIYSTTPNYTVYKCVDFQQLKFEKHIDIEWPLSANVPMEEVYFTSHIGSTKKIATGGSTNPIFIKDKNVYLYFIHTKIYSERKYNHYAVILDQNLNPIKLIPEPIIKTFVPFGLMFVTTLLETKDYLVFTGGVEDNNNFIWELSKDRIFRILGI